MIGDSLVVLVLNKILEQLNRECDLQGQEQGLLIAEQRQVKGTASGGTELAWNSASERAHPRVTDSISKSAMRIFKGCVLLLIACQMLSKDMGGASAITISVSSW